MQPTRLESAVRCYFPVGTTTLAAVIAAAADPVLFDSPCPLANAFHHRSLPGPKAGLAVAVGIMSSIRSLVSYVSWGGMP